MKHGLSIVNLGVATLEKITLTIRVGQCIGLTGPSGSGKTLLLRAIADLDPHDGEMWLDGICAERMAAHQWRRQVGLLPAESAWWHDRVGEHFEDLDPEWLRMLGFETAVMDWAVGRLSSGERQRLALLRLLARYPRVLLLDEPTANLDRDNIRRVESLLEAYRRSRQPITIWVSHDPDQLQRNCDAIYTVSGRQLVPLEGQAAGAARERA